MPNTDPKTAPQTDPETARKSIWPDVSAPVAPREDKFIEQLGRMRNDAYAWMKFVPETGTRTLENLPPRLRDHLQAERSYAQHMLEPLDAAADVFYRSMLGHALHSERAPAAALSGWAYTVEQSAGTGQKVFVRRHSDGRVQTLVDEAERAQGHAYYRATDHQHSPDDRYFAWAEDLIGNDRHRICVLDTQTGLSRVIVPEDAFGYGGLTFSPSSQNLFWIWRDAHSRPSRLYRSAVDAGSDAVLVHEEHDPALFMRVARTAADGFVALSLFGPDTSEVRLITAGDELAPARVLRPRERGIRYEVNEWDGGLIALTNADGATDRQILRLAPSDLQPTHALTPHRLGVPIITVMPFATTLVRLERFDGLHRLVLLQPGGEEIPIVFDEPSYVLELPPAQRWDASHVRVVHQTLAQPPRWLDVRLCDGEITEVGRDSWSGLVPDHYRIERLVAVADDGASVPITVLSRKDMDGQIPRPMLLTGYGAYGIAYEPVFSLPALAWVDAGYRYAIAHVRGGSEKGHDWYQGGCRENKRNSMTDFIACARQLEQLGYTTRSQTVAYGVSAGGLLVCGAANMQPAQWAGVIAQVPFVDMLNTMSDANHPLVPLLRPDWGDPLADPVAYDAMAAISPYENVPMAAYPPVLCTAGLKDDRVPYWEPAKLLANIRRQSTSGAPAVLLLNPESGHQESDQQEHLFMQAARFWAFAQHCVQVAAKQV
ncbi:S9 family peptidase (plasmid) [Diaphorobacter sp. HDW4B]|uniref:prolyl oligopeptidase family serine peptidase n=1 Tax=Diaphorobacter sp. HDW4B TaxID=2714925 RepID=UPI00140CDBC4|nr:prolyl oligopeptidase family serine peptidase [Diaphorobacter sp. HDW4B]QIL73754.1 S9 family peptidase [Diaphorobacter sp. HDW4B]